MLSLTGEAFFEVTPDKSRPFIIHADDADIRVVGTSFNVIPEAPCCLRVEVYVSTGVVEYITGRSGIKRSFPFIREISEWLPNSNVNSKKARMKMPLPGKPEKWIFGTSGFPMQLQILNEMYKVNIVCNEPGLDTMLTNGTYRYPDESLDQILTILCKQNQLKIEKR